MLITLIKQIIFINFNKKIKLYQVFKNLDQFET